MHIYSLHMVHTVRVSKSNPTHSPSSLCKLPIYLIFKKDFIYLFIFREKEREREREGEKHKCAVASHVRPHWGPGSQPRHVP